MNRYPIIRQEKESWSLPACLQSIVKLRRVYEPSQREIAKSLGIGKDCEGNLRERMDKFLEQYNLGCRHENPFTNVRGDSILLESELNCKTDVIVAYDSKRFNNLPEIPENIFSIVLRYFPLRKTIVTQSPLREGDMCTEILDLERLLTAINPHEDEEDGFYMIDSRS